MSAANGTQQPPTRTSQLPKQDVYTGASLVGSYIAIALYGLISHQMYRYYRMYPNDSKSLKIMVRYITVMVGIVWLLDSLHSIFISHTCYHYLVTDFLSPLSLINSVWSLQISITFTGVVATGVHLFFARRVFKITKNFWVSLAISITSLLCSGFAIAITIVSNKLETLIKFEQFTWLACTTLGLNTAADILITTSLYLYLQRCRTGFQKTDSIIDKLLVYVINTGLLNIAYNSAVLICAATMSDNYIYIGMFFIISKLYSNSLLAVLNSRKGAVHENNHGSFFHPQEIKVGTTQDVYELYNSDMRRRAIGDTDTTGRQGSIVGRLREQPILDIKVTREVLTVSDQMHGLEEEDVSL